MDKKEMSLVLVRLVKHEVERATNNLIDAEAALAAIKVRYEWENEKVEQMLKMGNKYSGQVNNLEMSRLSCKKELEQWREIQDFVVETFINNA